MTLFPLQVLVLMQGEPTFVDKFRKFKRNLEVSRNPSARWCIRAGCDNFMVGSAAAPRLQCDACRTEVCFNCSQGDP